MSTKVELVATLHIGGRPFWRMAKEVKPELSFRLEDADYDRVLAAAATELERRIALAKKKVKEPVNA